MKRIAGLLITLGVTSFGITACKSKSNSQNTNYCGLQASGNNFEMALAEYQRGRIGIYELRTKAEETVRRCEEIFSSCSPSEKDTEICNLADSYAQNNRGDGGGWNPRPNPGPAPQPTPILSLPLEQLQPGDIAFKVKKFDLIRDGQGFRNRQSGVTCKLQVSRHADLEGIMHVTRIDVQSRGRKQVYTLMTRRGFDVSCETSSRESLTGKEMANTIGRAITTLTLDKRGRRN